MTPSGSNTGNDQLLKAINSLTTAVNNISKMMSSQPSAGKRSGTPYRGGTTSGNGGVNGENTARRKRTVDDEYHRNRRNAKNQSKDINRLYSDFGKLNAEINLLRRGVKGTHEDLDIASKKQNEYVKAILESSKVTAKFQHGFQKQVDTMLKSSKSTSHVKFQGTTPAARMKEVVNMQETAQGLIAQTNKMKSDRKVAGVTALASGDIKTLAKSMSDSGFSIEGMDLDAFNQRLDNHDHRIRQKKREITNAKKHKHDPAKIQALQNEMTGLRANKEKFLARTIGKTGSSLEAFNQGITNGTRATFHAATANEYMTKGFEKLNMTTWGAIGSLTVLWQAFWKYADYVRGLAKQQLGGAHLQIGVQSLMMGASTEQFVKTMKQSMFQVTQIGLGKFAAAVKANTGVLNRMGLFGDEAVETFGDFAQTLTGMGVHPKDTKRFNAAFKEYAEQAQNMSAVTGITVKEYNALNNQLVNSSETQAMMMRLSMQERETKVKSIIVERDRIAKMIGSNEQAAKFIETMQKLNADKFDKRIDNSMKVLQVSQYLGMGNDGRRLAAIMRKRDDELSPEDLQFRNETMMKLGQRMESAKKSGRLNEPLIDDLNDVLGDLTSATRAGAEAKLAAENKGSITPGQEAKMAETAQIGKGWQAILTAESFWNAAVSNPIIGAIRTLTAVVIGYIALKNKDKILDFFKNGGIDKLKGGAAGGFDKLKNLITGGSKAAASATAAASNAASAAAGAANAATTVAGTAAAGTAGAGAAASGTSLMSKMAGAAKIAGKWAGIAGAVYDAGSGVMDLADGKRQSSMPSGLEMISPMRWGMYAGEKINQGTEWMLGDSLGSKIYDWTHGDDAIAATPAQTPGSRLAVGKITPAPANESKNAPEKVINKPETDVTVDEKKQEPLQALIDAVSSGTATEQTKLDEMIALLKILIDTTTPEKNGLLAALRNGTNISFNDIPDKRSLLASH